MNFNFLPLNNSVQDNGGWQNDDEDGNSVSAVLEL